MTEEEYFANFDDVPASEIESIQPFDSLLEEFENVTFDKNKTLRIEENIATSWSGVRSCGRSSRIQVAIRSRLDNWIQQKQTEYPHYGVIAYGHGIPNVRVRNTRAPWPSNRRACSGSARFKAYIEFEIR